jgi:hypothetical protein
MLRCQNNESRKTKKKKHPPPHLDSGERIEEKNKKKSSVMGRRQPSQKASARDVPLTTMSPNSDGLLPVMQWLMAWAGILLWLIVSATAHWSETVLKDDARTLAQVEQTQGLWYTCGSTSCEWVPARETHISLWLLDVTCILMGLCALYATYRNLGWVAVAAWWFTSILAILTLVMYEQYIVTPSTRTVDIAGSMVIPPGEGIIRTQMHEVLSVSWYMGIVASVCLVGTAMLSLKTALLEKEKA